MVMRTGLLHVPSLDADASAAVRTLLRAAAEGAAGVGAAVLLESAVGSQRNWIAETLRSWCDEEELDLVLTIGSTLPAPGPSAGECVPEATLEVLERALPGLSEAMRAEADLGRIPALLDRGVAGIRSRTLIVNLPAGAGAAAFLAVIVELLPAVVAHLQGQPDAPRFGSAALPAAPHEPPTPPARTGGLDADEFAAFLARRSAPPPAAEPE